MNKYLRDTETMSQFCRIHSNTKNKLPIRQSEMGLLLFVASCEHPPTSTDAVFFLKVSSPTVASMVNSLVEKGYLTKGRYHGDARRFTLLLTAKAKKLTQSASSKEYFKNAALLKKGLGYEDYTTLIHLLEKANHLLLAKNGGTR